MEIPTVEEAWKWVAGAIGSVVVAYAARRRISGDSLQVSKDSGHRDWFQNVLAERDTALKELREAEDLRAAERERNDAVRAADRARIAELTAENAAMRERLQRLEKDMEHIKKLVVRVATRAGRVSAQRVRGADMTFDEAFKKLLEHEGGFVDDPRDPGGKTRYGISQRAYPAENISAMTLDRAAFLYRRDYWEPAGCNVLPDEATFHVFDCAVNSGVGTAVRLMQQTVGAKVDGKLGPMTLAAIKSMDGARFAARFSGARLALMADLAGFPNFGRGWVRRVATNLMEA